MVRLLPSLALRQSTHHHLKMNACCNNESIILFGKLPLLPLLRVRNHLNARSLVLAALLSERWDSIVKKDKMRMEAKWDISNLNSSITRDGGLYIQLKFENYNEILGILFKEDAVLGMAEDVRVQKLIKENKLITFYHKNHRKLEESCLRAFQLLLSLCPPACYGCISVSPHSRISLFPIRFLLQLPRGTADSVAIFGDQEMDCADLMTFLQNVKVIRPPNFSVGSRLDIRVKMKNLVKRNEVIPLDACFIRIDDARFLSIDSLNQLNFATFHAGHNDFTSKDFNGFLHLWMKKELGSRVTKATFDIREDQNIKMEEVMKGLNPHLGTPRIRDRWTFENPPEFDGFLYPTATDYGDGWDIVDRSGMLGTVLLEPNRLTFITWPTRFSWKDYVKLVENRILSITQYLESLNRDRRRIQKKADAGKMELFPDQEKFLEKFPEKISIEQKRLAAACDTKEKLEGIWKNDEIIEKPRFPGFHRIQNPGRSFTGSACCESRLRWLNFLEEQQMRKTILIVGSADIALDAIPLALQFARRDFGGGRVSYTKMKGRLEIRIILVTDIASINQDHLSGASAFIYAYSDSDSFDRLSEMFISLQNRFRMVRIRPIIEFDSLLVQWSAGKDKKPNVIDVENFQRNSWTDAVEFDNDDLSEIEEFVVPIVDTFSIICSI